MSEFALLIDFGSTYTKLRAIHLDEAKILGSSQGPSTVTTDINVGMEQALNSLKIGLEAFRHLSIASLRVVRLAD